MTIVPFTIYDNTDGRILRSGNAQQHMVMQHLQSGRESLFLAELDPNLHYIENGRKADRPTLPDPEVSGSAIVFPASLPPGTSAVIRTRFVSATVEVVAESLTLDLPDEGIITFHPPWPYLPTEVTVSTEGHAAIDAQSVPPDLDLMKAHFLDLVRARGHELVDAMLGHPTRETKDNWRLKRSIRDRYLAGASTPGDDAAMAESTRYSGLARNDELDRIGARVEFEDWVVMRAEGLREEVESRLRAATAPVDILTVASWADTESQAAVAEAESRTGT